LTTQAVTSQPLTTQPLTTQAVTSQPLTTQPLTTQPLTTQELTTQELTTQELTTQELTTQELTTQELTTQELTTQPLTTQSLTTGAPSNPCYNFFEDYCLGNEFTLQGRTMAWSQFDVISFGSLTANTGDTEGRTAVKDNFIVGNGFSVGHLITPAEYAESDVSLLVGRDVTWGNGALYPLGAVSYVGGSFTGPDFLDLQYNTGCYGCTDALFDQAKTCYGDAVTTFSTTPVNTAAGFTGPIGGQLVITCNSYTETRYYIQVDGQTLSQTTSYSLDSTCNTNAQYVVSVTGNDDVTFIGLPFPQVAGGVVYVIPGERIIEIEIEVNGGILAPESTVVENGGVVKGKVVAGNIPTMIQFNRPCEYIASTTGKISSGTPSK